MLGTTNTASVSPRSAVVELALDVGTKEVVARWRVCGSEDGPAFPFAEAAFVPTSRLFGPERRKSVRDSNERERVGEGS